MLEVHVNINRRKTVVKIHAVRTNPTTHEVDAGTICTYDVYCDTDIIGTIEGTYGCGIDLGIKLLEFAKENKDEIHAIEQRNKWIKLYKAIEEGEKDAKNKRLKGSGRGI